MTTSEGLSGTQQAFRPQLRSYVFPIPSERDYDSLGHRLQRDVERSEKHPLSSGSVLSEKGATYFENNSVLGNAYSTDVVRWPDLARQVPEFFGRQRALHALFDEDGPDICMLKLQRPIQQGPGRWSQVWTATPFRPSRWSLFHETPPFLRPAKTAEVDGDLVIVKLFQECYFPWPETWDDHLQWRPAEVSACREAWAYKRLQPLQGTLLPRSYGFFTFVLPSGVRVVGHVMEYIKGRNIVKYLRKNGSRHNTAVQRPLLLRLFRAVYEIHALRVVNIDSRNQNILVPKADGDSLVVFDFDSARAENDHSSPGPEGTVYDAFSNDALQLRQVCYTIETMNGLNDWLKDKFSRPDFEWVRRLFPGDIGRNVLLPDGLMVEEWATSCKLDDLKVPDSDSEDDG